MKLNRREFLMTTSSAALISTATGFAASLAGCASMSPETKPSRVFFGTGAAGPGAVPSKLIYTASFDPATGAFGPAAIAAETPGPMYLGVSPDRRFLYSGMSGPAVAGGDQSEVIAYAIEGDHLQRLNAVAAGGLNVRWPTVDRAARHLLYLNYETGQVVVRALASDGQIGAVTSLNQHTGKGLIMPRQDKPHPHGLQLSPSERFAIVADLGIDQYVIYRYDAAAGTLTRHASIATVPGAGPRHFVFHPNGRFVYGSNEMNNTVDAFSWNDASGELKFIATVPSGPASFTERNIPGDIVLHPNGKTLYVTNRGHDSIGVYAVDAKTGTLTLQGHTPAGGQTPWALAFDPSHQWLLCADSRSNVAVSFKADAASRTLASSGQQVAITSPTWIVFA